MTLFNKTWMIALLAALSGAQLFAAASDVSKEGFFAAQSNFGADLPSDKIYPDGREFLYTFFSVGGGTEQESMRFYPEEVYQQYLKEFKDAGFTVLGPSYELDGRLLQDAKDHDMKLLYTVGIDMKFHSKEPVKMTDEEIKKVIGEQVSAVADNDEIIMWYLIPEEIRYWYKNEMAYLKAATEAIRENDPQGRPIWFYEPCHRPAAAMVKTSGDVDVIGKGMYTNGVGKTHERVWNRWSMQQETEAEELLGRDMLVLSLPEMYIQPADEDLKWIDTWVKNDVFTSLVDGAEGIVVFSARRRPNFEAFAQYYKAYLDLAPLLLGEDGLGQVFLFGEDRDDLHMAILSGPETAVMSSFPGAKVTEPIEYPSVAMADKVYKGKRYITLVNSTEEEIEAVVGGIPYMPIETDNLLDDAGPYTTFEGEIQVTLPPLGVAVYELSPAGASS